MQKAIQVFWILAAMLEIVLGAVICMFNAPMQRSAYIKTNPMRVIAGTVQTLKTAEYFMG